MSHKMLRQCIVKVSALGYFPTHIYIYIYIYICEVNIYQFIRN